MGMFDIGQAARQMSLLAKSPQGKSVRTQQLQTRGFSRPGAEALATNHSPTGAVDKLKFANHLGQAMRDGIYGSADVGLGMTAAVGGALLTPNVSDPFSVPAGLVKRGLSEFGSAAGHLGQAADGALNTGRDIAGEVFDGLLGG